MSHQMHQPVIANTSRPSYLDPTPPKGLYNDHSLLTSSYSGQNIRRSIVVQNLNPATKAEDLLAYLQETVTAEHCEILPTHIGFDAPPFRSIAAARVTLHSADEAKRAVALYNNTFFMRFRIRLKIDNGTPYDMPYDLAFADYMSDPSDLSAFESRATQHFTAPSIDSSSTGSDELTESHGPPHFDLTESSYHARPKSIDSCQPLVVNGSGIGGRTALAV